MLSWHYLILFSPAYGDVGIYDGVDNNYLFARQLALYVSLALCFFLIWVLAKSRKARPRHTSRRHAHIHIVGWTSVAIGALFAAASCFGAPLALRLVLIGCLGMLQAYMMTLWMRCLTKRYAGEVISSFGVYMISGGVLALLICLLQWPATLMGAILLPGISSLFLAAIRRKDLHSEGGGVNCTPEAQEDEQAAAPEAAAPACLADAPSDGSSALPEDLASSADDTASNAEAGGGAAPSDSRDAEPGALSTEDRRITTRNKRMLLFACAFSFTFGLLQGSLIVANIPILIVNNPVVLIGIIVAGLLMHVIPSNLSVTLSIDMMHRFSVILFVVGAVVVMWYDLSFIPVFFSQIVLLAGFNLFDFGAFAYGIEGYWGKENVPGGVDRARPQVYCCLAAGILLGYLTVSTLGQTHTTLLVICGLCIILVVSTTLMPLFRLSHSAKDETRASEADESESCAMQTSCPMILSLSSFPSEIAVVEDGGRVQSDRRDSPWKTACGEIARQYRLSPRETEIFMLVAKGRNADYIQSKLVISTHTAKTHIANIYHKLAVHSAQELLDLVEEYKHSDKR